MRNIRLHPRARTHLLIVFFCLGIQYLTLILSLLLMMIGICKVSTVAVFLKDGRYPQY